MEEVFDRFKELYEKRFQIIPVMDMGEDSVRYDFFLALQEVKNLNSYDIHPEFPISENAYVPKNHENSKRKEKPQIDLWVDTEELNIACEFGLFRQSSNINGSINKTEKTFKMLDDFLRLFLKCHFTGAKGYFICVADSKMLKHQLRNKVLGRFPADYYTFNNLELGWIIGDTKNSLDERFVNKLEEIQLNVNASLIYNEQIHSQINILETRILVWEILN
jgi:hypothetical protein